MKAMRGKSWIGVGGVGLVAQQRRPDRNVFLEAPGEGMLESVESGVLGENGCAMMG